MKKVNSRIKYKAIKIFKKKKMKLFSKIQIDNFLKIGDLKEKFVIIKVEYSNLNFKDFLMYRENNNLIKNFPHTPGIDASGRIYYSNSSKFKKNDRVYVIAHPLGVKSNGGLSEYITVPEKWVEKLPRNFTSKEIISIGTSGFTAIEAFIKAIKIIRKFKNKPVLVTGATGNVGIFLILLLNKLGINIETVTSKNQKAKELKKLGVFKTSLLNKFMMNPEFPMLNERYSIIFDNLGGEMLSIGLKYLIKNGSLISIGNVLGNTSKINLLPLILRGANIDGVNAESISKVNRHKILKIYKKYNIKKSLLKKVKVIDLKYANKLLMRNYKHSGVLRYIVKI